MNLSQKKRTRLYQGIVNQIKQLIRDKVLSPGDQLLPERQLAEEFGVGRQVVREALKALASKGLIEITSGGGSYVKKVSIDSLIDSIAPIMLKEPDSIHHLLEVQKILEKEMIKLAAQRATSSDLFRIRESVISIQKDLEKGSNAEEANIDFYLAIAKASQNPILYNICLILFDLIRGADETVRKQFLSEKGKLSMEKRFQIYEMITNREVT